MEPATKKFAATQALSAEIIETLTDADLQRFGADVWRDQVLRAGGRPAGEPTVTREPNISFGWPLHDSNDEPILDDDGQPIIDQTKEILIAVGMAYV